MKGYWQLGVQRSFHRAYFKSLRSAERFMDTCWRTKAIPVLVTVKGGWQVFW